MIDDNINIQELISQSKYAFCDWKITKSVKSRLNKQLQ